MSTERDRVTIARAFRDSEIAEARGYRQRKYQVSLAIAAEASLRRGVNVGIDLPTGTGKTMIANLVTLLWLSRRNRQRSRVLYVVPRRVLVGQHHEHAKWLSGKYRPVKLDANAAGNTRYVRRQVEQGKIIVSTPLLLGRAIRSGRVTRELAATIDLVVIDEADALLTVAWTESGLGAQLHESLEMLLSQLPNCRLLLLSATPPNPSRQREEESIPSALAACVRDRLGVSTWRTARRREYARYIPKAYVRLLPVFDDRVMSLATAIDSEISIAWNRIDYETDGEVDREYVMQRHKEITRGAITRLRTVSGSWMYIESEVRRWVAQITRRIQHRTFLFEDMMAGYSVENVDVSWWDADEKTWRPRLMTRTVDPATDTHKPELGNKVDALASCIRAHETESGVVFVRFLGLARALVHSLNSMGWDTVELHGEMDDYARFESLNRFKQQEVPVLVMTRDTGKRGLDIPESDYAVFYSPKTSERTMWQEMSRIRATTSVEKPSYLIFYDGTAEVKRLELLTAQMQAHPHHYEVRTVGGA